jgi:pantothenate kinase
MVELDLGATLALKDHVLKAKRQGVRRVIAIAGAPASGKSTLADSLVRELVNAGCSSQLVPMDGFHLHNPILAERGLLDRKGSPQTFDVGGLLQLVSHLGNAHELYYPVFDRSHDISIAGAGYIKSACDPVVIEGNYLLMKAPIWQDLAAYWDMSVMLNCSMDILETRLIQRWQDLGLTPENARARAELNDLPNARLVQQTAATADLVI